MSTQAKATWTFLSNHGHALIYLSQNPDARLRDIAEAVGITERFAHAVIADLVDAGYVTSTKTGRRNTYAVNPELTFRHPLEAGIAVKGLLNLFGSTAK
jgi:DNA-binding MarR family transcriptional regulator